DAVLRPASFIDLCIQKTSGLLPDCSCSLPDIRNAIIAWCRLPHGRALPRRAYCADPRQPAQLFCTKNPCSQFICAQSLSGSGYTDAPPVCRFACIWHIESSRLCCGDIRLPRLSILFRRLLHPPCVGRTKGVYLGWSSPLRDLSYSCAGVFL